MEFLLEKYLDPNIKSEIKEISEKLGCLTQKIKSLNEDRRINLSKEENLKLTQQKNNNT